MRVLMVIARPRAGTGPLDWQGPLAGPAYSVWTSLDGHHPLFVIGSGETRETAVEAALADLERAKADLYALLPPVTGPDPRD